MVNILVTGHKGRLGKLVKKELKKRDINVFGLDRDTDYMKLLKKNIDLIIHLAGTYTQDMAENLKDNVSLTNNMLRFAKAKQIPIFIAGSSSVFHTLSNYTLGKALVASLAIEYLAMGVDITMINLPHILYEKDNILQRIEKDRKKGEVIVDDFVFEYIEGKELAKNIVDWAEDGTFHMVPKPMSLWDEFKDKKNVKKGIRKNHLMHDQYGLVLQYVQQV